MLESLWGFPSCMPSALKLASVLFIECAGVGLLIARGIARVVLKAYHVCTDDPSTTSWHFGAETKSVRVNGGASIPPPPKKKKKKVLESSNYTIVLSYNYIVSLAIIILVSIAIYLHS